MAHGLTFHHFAQPRQLIVNSSCRIIDMQQAINPRAKSIQISYMAHAPTIQLQTRDASVWKHHMPAQEPVKSETRGKDMVMEPAAVS